MITELQQVMKKHFDKEINQYVKTYWDEDICAYVVRIDKETRRFIWFYGKGRSGSWIIQIMDNDGNQIGHCEYAANKRTLRS